MEFDLNNKVVQLCAKGMELEGLAQPEEAAKVFDEAWRLQGPLLASPPTTAKGSAETDAFQHSLAIRHFDCPNCSCPRQGIG
jgi:hypothetical protein